MISYLCTNFFFDREVKQKKNKVKKPKPKRLILHISERDYKKLGVLAEKEGARRAVIAMRFVRDGLKNTQPTSLKIANQLDIFDIVQTELFNENEMS